MKIENQDLNTKVGQKKFLKNMLSSVVYIDNKKDNGSGSGFIINHNGLKIITNWHVVETAKNVTICLRTKKFK